MSTRYYITKNDDFFIRTKKECTLAWTPLGTATLRLYGRFDLPDGVHTDVPLANGEISAATIDEQGNIVQTANVQARVNSLFVRVTGYNQPITLWVA